jgi:uncharacterized NAD(P)/FAD-binding protein YdhS
LSVLVRTIVIVGGGFCGTTLAARLLRRPPPGPTRVILIERSREIGRGVAYAQRPFPYLLNVPAGRMSANAEAPNEFLHFAQRRLPNVTKEDFLPRELYGEYLQEMLLAAQLTAPRGVMLEIWQGDVTGVRRVDRSLPLQVELADGRRVTADDVVLALGNPPPANLPPAKEIATHPAYVADPYSTPFTSARRQQVLLIGTSLTAADIVNALSNDPAKTPTLHLLSRHGLVPPRQTAFRPDAFKGDGNALLLVAATSLRGLTSSVRLLAREAEAQGGDWREAVTFVRNMAPTIWQRLPERDRMRFLRHLRAQWDVHRHRLPPETLSRFESLRQRERMYVHAGRIVAMRPEKERISVTWRPRGASQTQTQSFDRVINCTGPDYAIARSNDPLWRNLLQCGLCVPDALGLGLKTGPHGAVVDADGWPGPHLFYLGPMLRADHWEATAAAELRVHAERLAALLAQDRTQGSR